MDYIYITYLFNPQQCCNDANLLSRCKKPTNNWVMIRYPKPSENPINIRHSLQVDQMSPNLHTSNPGVLIRASRNQSSEFIVQLLILAHFEGPCQVFALPRHGMLICQVQFVACSSQRVYTMDQEGKR